MITLTEAMNYNLGALFANISWGQVLAKREQELAANNNTLKRRLRYYSKNLSK